MSTTVICQMCGKEIQAGNKGRMYCQDCMKIRKRTHCATWRQRHGEEYRSLQRLKALQQQLPDGTRLSATVFNSGRFLPKKTVHFQIIAPHGEYGPYFEYSWGTLVDKLTQLRQRIVKGEL